MEQQYFKILVFSLWFVLPLLPAFILYKYLPKNQVAVKGPFKGLTVDMAGAFAGYFLLFLASYVIVRQLLFQKLEYEVWTVKGTVFDDKGKRVDANRHKPDISVLPKGEILNGSFEFQVPVKVDEDGYDFPRINIVASTADVFRDALVVSSQSNDDFFDLDVVKGKDNGNWKYDFHRKVIRYIHPIKLSKAVSDSNRSMQVIQTDFNTVEVDAVSQ